VARFDAFHAIGAGEPDDADLQAFSPPRRGAGEWLFEKYGTSKRRSWRKLHIGIDADSDEIPSTGRNQTIAITVCVPRRRSDEVPFQTGGCNGLDADKGQDRQKWGDLDNGGLDEIGGHRKPLIGMIQERYGMQFEKIVDAFLAEIAATDLTVPKPDRPRGGYSTKPGPKKRVNGAGEKALESRQENTRTPQAHQRSCCL
jgi:uncharacterized protein YjbJ (UPF0337 family)